MSEKNRNKLISFLSRVWKFRGYIILLLGLGVMGHVTYSFVYAENNFLAISRQLSIEQFASTVMIIYGLYRVFKKGI